MCEKYQASRAVALAVGLVVGCGDGKTSVEPDASTAADADLADTDPPDGDIRPVCEEVGPIDVTRADAAAFAPQLVWTGTELALLWAEQTPSGGCDFQWWSFARLSRSGVLASEVLGLSTEPAHDVDGELVWSGTQFLATLVTDEGQGPGVYLYRVSSDGSGFDSPVKLASDVYGHASVWTGSQLSMLYSGSETSFRAFGSDGTPLADAVLVDDQPGLLLDLSYRGSAYSATISGSFAPHYYVGLKSGGTPITDAVKVCCAPAGISSIGGPASVEQLGDGALMAWQDQARPRAIQLTRFDSAGASLGDAPITPESWTMRTAMAARAGEVGLIWKDDRTEQFEVYFARFDESGARLEADRPLSTGHEWIGCGQADMMSIVATDTGYAVAWAEQGESSTSTIKFAHVCPSE